MKVNTHTTTMATDNVNIITTTTTQTTIDYYLSEEIGDPMNFRDIIQRLSMAHPSDIFKIHINCHGGQVYSAIQLMAAIKNCPSKNIMASVEGLCASSATLVFLACDSFIIHPYSSFLFHNYSSWVGGKGGDLEGCINHSKEWSRQLFGDMYKDLLTKKELSDMMTGKDIWLSGDDVENRMPAYCRKHNAR